jgi:hypothetical protein
MSKNGCIIEYYNDDQVCIIPNPFMPVDDFGKILKLYSDMGYKVWLPADHRRGYILSKVFKDEDCSQTCQ